MRGILNRGLQNYVCDLHGIDTWEKACEVAGLPFYNFEAMLTYEAAIFHKLLAAICKVIGRSADEVLEDFGTYVVSEQTNAPVRYLFRLGGDTFSEFLLSIEDVLDRAHMAIPDLPLPDIQIDFDGEMFILTCLNPIPGLLSFIKGVLQAMADDYQELALVTDIQTDQGFALSIQVLNADWMPEIEEAC